jgi:hypothetical protein
MDFGPGRCRPCRRRLMTSFVTVTNPPWGANFARFLAHALTVADHVAAFLGTVNHFFAAPVSNPHYGCTTSATLRPRAEIEVCGYLFDLWRLRLVGASGFEPLTPAV